MSIPRTIWFYIPSKVHVLDLTGPIQVFYEANTYGANYQLKYFSTEESITSAAGLPFGRIEPFTAAYPVPGDYIVIPGAEMEHLYSPGFLKNRLFFDWLFQLHQLGVFMCSVCTGAFILAEAGLLNNVKCTTHWKRLPELKAAYPAVIAEEDILYTFADNIYTSAGITSGIDLSLAIIEEHYGPLFAHKVARELVVYHRRGQSHHQNSIYLDYRNHLNVRVHVTQDWLIDNLAKKFTLEDLAEITNMSPRNLTRMFRKATGISINEYVRKLRIEKAGVLSNNPEYTADYIASQIGYSDSRQLRRIKKISS